MGILEETMRFGQIDLCENDALDRSLEQSSSWGAFRDFMDFMWIRTQFSVQKDLRNVDLHVTCSQLNFFLPSSSILNASGPTRCATGSETSSEIRRLSRRVKTGSRMAQAPGEKSIKLYNTLVVTSATLVVTGALLVVTKKLLDLFFVFLFNKCHASSNRCLTSSNKEAIDLF